MHVPALTRFHLSACQVERTTRALTSALALHGRRAMAAVAQFNAAGAVLRPVLVLSIVLKPIPDRRVAAILSQTVRVKSAIPHAQRTQLQGVAGGAAGKAQPSNRCGARACAASQRPLSHHGSRQLLAAPPLWRSLHCAAHRLVRMPVPQDGSAPAVRRKGVRSAAS